MFPDCYPLPNLGSQFFINNPVDLFRPEPRAVQFGEPNLDHLYRPSAYSSGYKVIAPTYEHTNGTFSHTGGDVRGSFIVAPDWVSERKKSVVLRH